MYYYDNVHQNKQMLLHNYYTNRDNENRINYNNNYFFIRELTKHLFELSS